MPTEKRQRQKEGRRVRLEAERKVERRRQLIRRTVIVVVIAAVVVGSVYLLTRNSSNKSATTTTTTTTLPVHHTTAAEIAATTAVNAAISAIVAPLQRMSSSQIATAQAAANARAVAAGCPASVATRVNTLTWTTPPPMTISTTGTYRAVVSTDVGSFTITLNPKEAPQTVNNFIFLAKHGYYKCVIFHRVIPYFMNQTGDPTGTGSGGPGYTIPDENPPRATNPTYQYPAGGVAMANTGSPDTGGSQFFLITGMTGESLPNTYALFGRVTSGLAVAAAINGTGSAAGVPPNVTHRMLSVTVTGPYH